MAGRLAGWWQRHVERGRLARAEVSYMLADRQWARAVGLSRSAAEARSRAAGVAGAGGEWPAAGAADLAEEVDGRTDDAERALEGSDSRSTVPGRWTAAMSASAISLAAAHNQSAAEWASRGVPPGAPQGALLAKAAKAEMAAADGWLDAAARATQAERAAKGTVLDAPGSPSEEEERSREAECAKRDAVARWDRAAAAWLAAAERASAAGDRTACAAAARRAKAASTSAETVRDWIGAT